jgi:glutamate synthase (NADPH/NADH) small chain
VGKDVTAESLVAEYDAVVLTGGAEAPRDLPVPGRDLAGIHFAMEFLPQQNRVVAGDRVPDQIVATGKHVIVIGGGDTGSDCVGTSNRQRAKSITQFELLPQPPQQENKPVTWPYWPIKLRTSSSHQEGCERDWAVATKRFEGRNGRVENLVAVRVEWRRDESGMMKMIEVPGTEFELKADLVLLAMGFTGPVREGMLEELAVAHDPRGNVRADTEDYRTVGREGLCGRATCGADNRSSSGRSAKGRQCARASTNS